MFFNSRNIAFRDPVGAVEQNSNVHFRIIVPRELRCSQAVLLLQNDNTKQMISHNMFWCGMSGDNHEWWECDFTPTERGLFFYHFEVETWRGRLNITRSFGGEGGIDGSGSWWQMTVYEEGFQTPDWLAGGVMYQVFPDRFYNSGKPKENVPQDRFLHTDWYEMPHWRPNEHGEVTNSDYFGGDLQGVIDKLPYLQSLGVTCLYLNPIFEAHSNHRYNTADYSKVDPLLGTNEDFKELCSKAKKFGISVMLDGVFSHTGSDSIYFNREGRYDSLGAYQSKESPYFPWFQFRNWPNDYESWWNFFTLPNVNETNPAYDSYINGPGGIVQSWLEAGASGWRLDVADELPDSFIDNLSAAAKAQKPDAVVLGEVWEDASNKTAYSVRRRYLLGGQLDSVMNYPFRDAILGFLTGQPAPKMMDLICDVLENYPPQVTRLLMNHIGTHDTERAITMLAGEPKTFHDREWQSQTHLSPEQWELGVKRMKLAALMQFTLPGVPCIYYGDEAGMEGYRDPFNRACYPWGREREDLLLWYRRLGRMRKKYRHVFREGPFQPILSGDGCIVYLRSEGNRQILIALNANNYPKSVSLLDQWHSAKSWHGALPENGFLTLPPLDCAVLIL